MSPFIIYPAIDLRYGRVVRLKQGKADQETKYSDDPGEIAQKWITQGAEWLHVVNLNGAFGEETRENEAALKRILSVTGSGIKVQFGGGIRTLEQIDRALFSGVTRVVLGTAAIESPDFGVEVLKQFPPDRVAFGFDALGQQLMTEGWQSDPGVRMMDLAKKLADAGGLTLIYTNIKKDGMQTGVDWEVAQKLAAQTGMAVIASGGVASLKDIEYVRAADLDGVIVGRALYEGNFTLKEALDAR